MASRRVVFMGTPDFAVPALQAIHGAGHTIVGVYTKADSPAGRGRELSAPPVKLAARELGLTVFQPSNLREPEALGELRQLSPDVIVVAAYALLLPQKVLSIPRYGCKNIHASLLPKYRGGAPIHWAVVNGESETGITIMQMAKGLDTGDIILQQSTPIGPNDTCGDVFTTLAALGAKLILKVLDMPDMGESLRQEQEHALATFARNVSKEDGRLNFTQTAQEVHNNIRGFNPWPGAFTTIEGKYLRILRSKMIDSVCTALQPGQVETIAGKVVVGCNDAALELCMVQPAGKRAMPAADFMHGNVGKTSKPVFLAT